MVSTTCAQENHSLAADKCLAQCCLKRALPLLEMIWQESGGPAIPTDRSLGFGTFIIEKGLPDAKVEQRFEPGGLVCTIKMPV